MVIIKKILTFFHPLLRGLYFWYGKKTRSLKYKDIPIKVFPGVFHPALFFSTKILLEFLEQIDLQGKKILELGCGTGLISIYCYKRGADVTASDISEAAIQNTAENNRLNGSGVKIIKSDLFAQVSPNDFSIILINPPYYPKQFNSESERAWFCGEHFEYFENLFEQLGKKNGFKGTTYMILSEECDLSFIQSIGNKNGLIFRDVFRTRTMGEENRIFEITLSDPVHSR